MEAKDFQALVDQLGGLTKEQREALIEAVEVRASADDAIALIDCRFAAAPCCPHCRSVDVGTWSKPKPLTRYMCHVCGRTFTALTGTPLERSAPATRGSPMARRWPMGSACAGPPNGVASCSIPRSAGGIASSSYRRARKRPPSPALWRSTRRTFSNRRKARAKSRGEKPANAAEKLQSPASRTSTPRC